MAEGDVGLDFHRAFMAIDTDHSGEITIDELQTYCRKMNYQETFVQKWLKLFDEDQNGRITYAEYCNSLGLPPKKDVVAKHQEKQQAKAAAKPACGKPTRAVKVAKRRKEQVETTVTVTPVSAEQKLSAAVAPTTAASAASAAPVAATSSSAKTRRQPRRRNQPISGSGDGALMRYSRARMFQRKALYRLTDSKSGGSGGAKASWARQASGHAKTASQRPKKVVEKPIGGEKNGGIRCVPTRRAAKSLPTETPAQRIRRRPKRCFAGHRRRLRASLQPGCVLILLAGRHRGKRVVFLGQLPASGLLLVTGPMRLNGCPLRRVCQSYVIATRTRVDIDGLRLPERVNDLYFRRTKRLAKKLSASAVGDSSSSAEDPFARQSVVYQLTQERRDDQKVVDAQVMSAIGRLDPAERKLMLGYLSSLFSLKSGQRPHEMIF